MSEEERQSADTFKSMLRAASKTRQTTVVKYLVAQDPRFEIDRETGLAVATGGSVQIYEEKYKIGPEVLSLQFDHIEDPIIMAVRTNNVPIL